MIAFLQDSYVEAKLGLTPVGRMQNKMLLVLEPRISFQTIHIIHCEPDLQRNMASPQRTFS